MTEGWIKLHRKMMEKGWFSHPGYVSVWIFLLFSANIKETEYLDNGEIKKLKRGQLITGRKKISKKTGVSETTVERILKCFESGQQLGQQKKPNFRLITIHNFDLHQQRGQPSGQPADNQRTTSGQPADNQRTLYKKERKKEREERKNKSNIYTANFEEFWIKYPNRIGKKQALQHFQASVKNDEDMKNIQKAIDNYTQSKRVMSGFIMNASTWFNNWRDWIEYSEQSIVKEKNQDIQIKKRKEEEKKRKKLEEVTEQENQELAQYYESLPDSEKRIVDSRKNELLKTRAYPGLELTQDIAFFEAVTWHTNELKPRHSNP